jgi:hypothetical protein
MIGFPTPNDYDEINLLDDYDTIETYDKISGIYDEEKIRKLISVPKHSSNYLHDIPNNSLFPFKFSNGASFIVDKKLTGDQFIKLLNIMTSLVTMYNNDNTIVNSNNKNTYKNLPTTIVGCALRARWHQDGKTRLLRRAVTHAVDQRTDNILDDNTNGEVVTYDNQPAILVSHGMKASMRKSNYRAVVCFNSDTVIACQCDCKAGAFVNGKVLCVHILPIIYQITFHLFNGLAEHIITEVANQWNRLSVDMDEDMKNDVKHHLMILKSATRHYDDGNEENINIETFLNQFLVGTERPKKSENSTNK